MNPARRSAAFVTHAAFLAPGFGRHHPLSNGRQAAVISIIEALGWFAPGERHDAPLPSVDVLARFHEPAYLDTLARVDRDGLATAEDRATYNLGTMECPVFDGMFTRARASVGGAIRAADLALAGRVAFHPAGGTHHGQPGRASGFCYLNDPVFAMFRLLDAGCARVAYVDLDAHHGDGVAAAFAREPRIALFSVHEAGRWPGTGATGVAAGGRMVDMAVPRGIGGQAYRRLADTVLLSWLTARRPDAVVVVAGADPLAGDPLSTMALDNLTLWGVIDDIVATTRCAVVLGGGGYNPWTTVRFWVGLWGRLSGRSLPRHLPGEVRRVLAGLTSDLIDADDRKPWWLDTLADPDPSEIDCRQSGLRTDQA